jgi:pimeloyl-ACP methyl ester carboxylesterase
MKLGFIAACLALLTSAAGAQEIITVESRPGVTQSVLMERAPGKPTAIALLFPGGGGNIRLRNEGGHIRFGPNNFLVRSRTEFVKHGVIAVVFDAPSDQSGGMDDTFRLGDAHAADVAAVIGELKKRHPALPVFAVGTSRGTVSAASMGRRMPEALAGTVLTASLFLSGKRVGQQGLDGFDFAGIKPRLLFAHHRQDGCASTPYRSAAALAERYPLISVSGGLPAQSPPCDALSEHGFLGREGATVEAIVNWMLERPYQKEIH